MSTAFFFSSAATAATTGPWHIDGTHFADASGNRVTYKGCTDFRLFKRHLDGEDIGPIVTERLALGANVARVLTMAVNLFPLDPDHYTDADLLAFLTDVNDRGLKVELVALADCNTRSLAWQQAHFARICRLAGDNLVELVNEWNVQYQNVDTSKFTQPSGVLSSHGSPGAGGKFPMPYWSYCTWHPERDGNWIRTMTKELFDFYAGFPGFPPVGRPCLADEPKGFAEAARADRSTSPVEAFECGVEGALLGGGCTFHSDNGLQSQLFQPTQKECARRFFQGVSVWDLWR